MIVSGDNANVTVRCPVDGTEFVVAVASLKAGFTAAGHSHKHLLPIPTVCPTDGTKITCLRTYANPSRHAGLVNGLHEHLVQAAQIGSAELGGEAGDAKPTFRYTINGTPILPLRGAAGEIEWDLDQIVALHGANGARQDLELGLILTNASDAAIDLFVAILYATEGDRTTAANLLRALRAKAAFA